MNQKELNEIRRRFKLDKNSISKIFGCYVNSNKEIISWIDASMGLMQQEEQEMYLGLLKKALSGALGKNLVDSEFVVALLLKVPTRYSSSVIYHSSVG